MRKKRPLLHWAYLLAAGLTLAACGSDDAVDTATPSAPSSPAGKWSVTVNVGVDETRGLSLSGTTLSVNWKTGEAVYAYYGGQKVGELHPTANSADGNVTLQGNLDTADYAAGQSLTLKFPRETTDYTGQAGTIEDIAAKYDYLEAAATISSVDAAARSITVGPATFTSQQAIARLTFSEDLAANDVITITGAADDAAVSVTLASAVTTGNPVFVALPLTASSASYTFGFTVTRNSSALYEGSLADKTLQNAKYYAASVTLTASAALSQKTMVVLSDIHVMGPGILVSEGEAWNNYLASERKMVDYSRQIFDEQIEDLKTMAPDLVLITGDLTKDGERASHEYVAEKLKELPATTKVLVIPGNHDRGTSNAKIYDGATATNAEVLDDAGIASAYASFGYGPDSRRDDASLTYACEPFPGLVVIGIDSKNGSLAAATVDFICSEATAARAAGKQVIAMMHHALIPHITNADTFVGTAVINDYDNMRLRFIEAGIPVVFTGHFHVSDIAKDYNDALTSSIIDVATGAPISYPCDYRVVGLSDNYRRLSIETRKKTTLTGVADFSTVAHDRLHAAIKKNMKTRVESKYGAMASMFSAAIDQMATAFADAYIIHADGNEPQADAAAKNSIITVLTPAFALLDGSEDMIRSMLEDKAPYGIEGRENVTDDRTLLIVSSW